MGVKKFFLIFENTKKMVNDLVYGLDEDFCKPRKCKIRTISGNTLIDTSELKENYFLQSLMSKYISNFMFNFYNIENDISIFIINHNQQVGQKNIMLLTKDYFSYPKSKLDCGDTDLLSVYIALNSSFEVCFFTHMTSDIFSNLMLNYFDIQGEIQVILGSKLISIDLWTRTFFETNKIASTQDSQHYFFSLLYLFFVITGNRCLPALYGFEAKEGCLSFLKTHFHLFQERELLKSYHNPSELEIDSIDFVYFVSCLYSWKNSRFKLSLEDYSKYTTREDIMSFHANVRAYLLGKDFGTERNVIPPDSSLTELRLPCIMLFHKATYSFFDTKSFEISAELKSSGLYCFHSCKESNIAGTYYPLAITKGMKAKILSYKRRGKVRMQTEEKNVSYITRIFLITVKIQRF